MAVFSGFPADFTNGFRSELELGRVDSTLIPADVIMTGDYCILPRRRALCFTITSKRC